MLQFTALLVTIVIESVVIAALCYRQVKSPSRLFAIAVAPTLITHPILWFLSIWMPPSIPYAWGIFFLELMVVLGESAIIRIISKLPWRVCMFVSVVANASSAFIGLWWWRFTAL